MVVAAMFITELAFGKHRHYKPPNSIVLSSKPVKTLW